MKIQGSRQNPEMRQGLEFRESEGPQVESLSFRESLISGPVSALMTEEPAVEVRGGLRRKERGSSVPQATPRAGAMESARIGFATPRGLGGPGGKVGGHGGRLASRPGGHVPVLCGRRGRADARTTRRFSGCSLTPTGAGTLPAPQRLWAQCLGPWTLHPSSAQWV